MPEHSSTPTLADKATAAAPPPSAEQPTALRVTSVAPGEQAAAANPMRRWIWIGGAVAALLVAAYFVVPWVRTALTTVSTDDAYVDGHVTLVAPRVSGQVARVLVDDNDRVRKGDVLVELDPEPYRVEVEIKQAAVASAEASLGVARTEIRGMVAQARSNRFSLEHAIENVENQLATLRSNVAQQKVEEANLELAQRDYDRNRPLVERGAVTQAEFDQNAARLDVARNRVLSAEQVVQETRSSLGLKPNRENPLDVPKDLDQNYSGVRQALEVLLQSAAQLGYMPKSWNIAPREAIAEFYSQDPQGNLDRIYTRLIAEAPSVKQAEAKLLQAQRDLEQAKLDLSYCRVVSEIDGVVTRRNVNPGNNVQAGQSLMAVRSIDEIWVTANFKETQLADLRIGQPVTLEVDMYGRRKEFAGRISGFTMGTGQTLAILPPQNATGNFVKIVQRLPVRIELLDYDPQQDPLFVGVSVVPYVHFKEEPTGPNAGKFLQEAPSERPPVAPSATAPTAPPATAPATPQPAVSPPPSEAGSPPVGATNQQGAPSVVPSGPSTGSTSIAPNGTGRR